MNPPGARTVGAGELWLLATPLGTRLAALAPAFAEAPAQLLARDDPDSRAAGEALARALGAEPCLALPAVPEAALAALAERLRAGGGRVLALLPAPEVPVLVARALGLSPARAAYLRVDAGRLTLLRAEDEGFVLRRANVLAPERDSGTALPTGRSVAP